MQIILLLSWRQTSNWNCLRLHREKSYLPFSYTKSCYCCFCARFGETKNIRRKTNVPYGIPEILFFFYANYFNANRVHTSMWGTCHGILLPIEFIHLSNEHLKHDILTFHRISYQWHSMSLVFLFLSTILSASEPSAGLSNCSYIWLWFLFTIRLNDTYFIIKRWMCAMQSKSFIYNYVGSSDGFFSFKMRWLWNATLGYVCFWIHDRIEKLKDIDILALRISSLCTDSI